MALGNPFEHVSDNDHFALFETAGVVIHLPTIHVFGHEVPIKFMLLMTVCAVAVGWALIWLGNKMKDGDPPKGYLWNLMESLLFFVRDKIARPGVGEEDARQYTPFLATLFLFIFSMNVIGLLPFSSSPTASIMVTAALALVSFLVIHISGLREHGTKGYLRTFVPHIEMPHTPVMQAMGVGITVGIAALEYATAFIRGTVLAVRLFANMLAGHTVLFILLAFIQMIGTSTSPAAPYLFIPVTISSIALVTALTLLELFIAGLQAFIFTFLTAVFVGLAKHPPH